MGADAGLVTRLNSHANSATVGYVNRVQDSIVGRWLDKGKIDARVWTYKWRALKIEGASQPFDFVYKSLCRSGGLGLRSIKGTLYFREETARPFGKLPHRSKKQDCSISKVFALSHGTSTRKRWRKHCIM